MTDRYLPNLGGLDYNGPFYRDSTPRAIRLERREMVTHYVPHTFAEYPKGDVRRGLCRICAFPGADAACAAERRAEGWVERTVPA
jgi:hypothetical protein